jgi:hypothetical protein
VLITTTRCSTASRWWHQHQRADRIGIVGRPVFTVLASEFAGQQEGTLHFKHLTSANGGLLNVATSMPEHLAQLAAVVRGEHDATKSRAFVQAFVRPHGLDTPAAGKFVEVIEATLARAAAGAGPDSLLQSIGRRC